jgi:hypothetical protein
MKRVIKNMMRLMVACVFAACSSSDDELMPGAPFIYEENPTTLEGTWHLVKANYGWGGIKEYPEGDIEVVFNPSTMLVIQHSHKDDEKNTKPFLDDGTYTYQIFEAKHDGGSKRLAINGSEDGPAFCFHDGMLIIDYGMAADGPGYYFKKVIPTFSTFGN